MTDVRLNLALAALQTIAGCGLDAAGMARTAVVALAAIDGLEPKRESLTVEEWAAKYPEEASRIVPDSPSGLSGG